MVSRSRRVLHTMGGGLTLAILTACNAQIADEAASVGSVRAALHETEPTELWVQRLRQENSVLQEYDIMSDTMTGSCVPAGAEVPPNPFGFGCGVAHDPTDDTLWYSALNAMSPDGEFVEGGGLLHHMTLDCTELPPLVVGDGSGGTMQDDLDSLDLDPDDGNIWANGNVPFGDTNYHAFYKIDRNTGEILQSCEVYPLSADVRGNDTLAIARLEGLPGSGKYILSDVAPGIFSGGPVGVTIPIELAAYDAEACTGGLGVEVLPVATFVVPFAVPVPDGQPVGLSGIDFEKGELIGVYNTYPDPMTMQQYLVDFGGPPFSSVLAVLQLEDVPELVADDISLRGNITPINQPPVARCQDVTVDDACSASASIDDGSYDPEDGTVTCVQDPIGPFGLEATEVTLTCTDSQGATDGCSATVTVNDATPPVFTYVPPAVTTTLCGSLAIGEATASDACGSVTVTDDRPTRFPPGTTRVTWTAEDAAGNSVEATQTVTVVLTNNPACCPAGTNVIVGTSNDNRLTGTIGSDCILGLGAQDTIYGLGGNDYISGGDGDDTIYAGTGNDVVFGGTGQDKLYGEGGADFLSGDDGVDQVWGGDGADKVLGGQGADRLYGDGGNDTLMGGADDDRLEGGAGDDSLDGSGLHDVCLGGPGTDTFLVCETKTP
jgi:hypothetical protein